MPEGPREQPLIAWSMATEGHDAGPEIALYPDGQVLLALRFGGGERRLSVPELEAFRRFVFDEQRLLEIDPSGLEQAVQKAAVEHQQDAAGPAVEMVAGMTMDAGTTVIRANLDGRQREISYYDLAGDAAAYPGVESLQRLRAVELRLLELAARR